MSTLYKKGVLVPNNKSAPFGFLEGITPIALPNIKQGIDIDLRNTYIIAVLFSLTYSHDTTY